jgi:hypothetical protein
MIRIDLLKKLEHHLRNGKLGHIFFDFTQFNWGNEVVNQCGTSGCAAGELPILFPNEWKFYDNNIYLKNKSIGITKSDVCSFFGIGFEMFRHLFLPMLQHKKLFGGKILYNKATKEEVADNMAIFIEKVEKGEITL